MHNKAQAAPQSPFPLMLKVMLNELGADPSVGAQPTPLALSKVSSLPIFKAIKAAGHDPGPHSTGFDCEVEHACAACGKTGAKKCCSRCKRVWYCSKDCQTAAWKTHKLVCKSAAAK